MSTDEKPESTGAEPAGEPRQMSERTAKAILLIIAFGAIWGIVRVVPYVAYFVAGILTCRGWQKTRGWIGRRQTSGDAESEAAEVDVVEVLQLLARGGRSVLLTELRDEIGAADTKVVKALLDEAGVRWREGVRTPAGNGPGVYHDDVPPLSPVGGGAHEGRCSCRSTANANANNADSDPPGEGLRVVPIGQAGTVVHDPADAVRHHKVRN